MGLGVDSYSDSEAAERCKTSGLGTLPAPCTEVAESTGEGDIFSPMSWSRDLILLFVICLRSSTCTALRVPFHRCRQGDPHVIHSLSPNCNLVPSTPRNSFYHRRSDESTLYEYIRIVRILQVFTHPVSDETKPVY